MEDYLTNDFSAKFREINEADYINDTNDSKKHGNHKPAKKYTTNLMEHVTKEIVNGFQFPFHPTDVCDMKGAVVSPQGNVF